MRSAVMRALSRMRFRQRCIVPALIAAMAIVPAAAQQAPGENDLQALRYYLQQGDTAARDAELRRLRQAFPDWAPPANLESLLLGSAPVDEQPIYDLIAEERYDAARAAIAATEAEYPGWSPSQEMLRLLRLGEGQAALDQAFAAGDLAAARAAARANPDLLRCDRINNAWRLAEGEANAGNDAAALQSYRAIVRACTDVSQIIATIEKADAVASQSELQALIRQAKARFPTRVRDFDGLEERLIAGRGGAVRTARPRDETTTRVRPGAPSTRQPSGRTSAPTRARGRGSTDLTIYGDLPRTGDGRVGAARAAAAQSAWGKCLAASSNPRSLDIAYQRGWCAYNSDRPMEAMALFLAALNGHLSADVTRDARYGLALALVNLDMTEEAAEVAAGGSLTREQRRTIEKIILDQRAVRAFNLRQYHRAIAFFNALEASYGLRRDLAILRAYAYLNIGERVRSFREFQKMDQELSTPETRRGLVASQPEL